MKQVKLGNTNLKVPAVITGCMRLSEKTPDVMNKFIHTSIELSANFFDHADIYGAGKSEEVFGNALKNDSSIKREDLIIQSKCGIDTKSKVPNYNFTKDYIINAVEGSLKRLNTDYLDILLLHRPDALVEPEEVAEAFDKLESSGKVKMFGVSNHKPFQMENWQGCFIGSEKFPELNKALEELAEKYSVSTTAISTAWITRHPAQMQVIAGTTSENRLKEIIAGSDIVLTHEEWYKLYLAAGHILP